MHQILISISIFSYLSLLLYLSQYEFHPNVLISIKLFIHCLLILNIYSHNSKLFNSMLLPSFCLLVQLIVITITQVEDYEHQLVIKLIILHSIPLLLHHHFLDLLLILPHSFIIALTSTIAIVIIIVMDLISFIHLSPFLLHLNPHIILIIPMILIINTIIIAFYYQNFNSYLYVLNSLPLPIQEALHLFDLIITITMLNMPYQDYLYCHLRIQDISNLYQAFVIVVHHLYFNQDLLPLMDYLLLMQGSNYSTIHLNQIINSQY